jgi:hypothetical protein
MKKTFSVKPATFGEGQTPFDRFKSAMKAIFA